MTYQPNEGRYGSMVYHHCGASGLKLPAVSLGMWHNFGTHDDFDNMEQLCFTAIDYGVTHFDLDNNYGPIPGSAEENFGRIINHQLKPYRDELIISTKAGYDMWPGPYGDGGSRKYMLASLDQSLKRMELDYVDIFYHHRMDFETPLEESMMALDTAVKSGKALYAGISNYDSKHTAKAMKILKELRCPFIINQVNYSIFNRFIEEDGLKSFAAKNGCGLIAFSPLAQGMLTNRYLEGVPEDSRVKKSGVFLKNTDLTPERMEQIQQLSDIAKERGQSLAQMALSWVLRDGEVTSVLIGASKPEQLLENLKAIRNIDFSHKELKEIDRISGGGSS